MSTQIHCHVVIVGSGMAGMAAADTLSGQGLDVLIIDENTHAGGQLIRKVPRKKSWFSSLEPDIMKKKGFTLARRMNRPERIQAQVLGFFDDKTLLLHTGAGDNGGGTLAVQAEHIIFATGARERYLPFKGWDLPGVISLGAAQILMKSQGILPARELIVAGTSPLMMVLTTELYRNGASVTALVDENSLKDKLKFLPLAKNHWPKLLEGGYHMGRMALARTPVYQGMRIVEACGRRGVETVTAAGTNARGDVIRGTEKTFQTGTLALGHGFAPNIELAVQAGCDVIHNGDRGGWVVQVDDRLETSLPAVYAAGEITGIAGARKSYVEGRLAALSVLEKYGTREIKKGDGTPCDIQRHMEKLRGQQRQQTAYGAFLNQLCRVPASAYAAIPDDTVICRCEEITMGEIKKSISSGEDTTGGLKKATRCGMGRCQGRICGPVVADIMTALTRRSPEKIGTPRTRFPVKNVPLGDLRRQEPGT